LGAPVIAYEPVRDLRYLVEQLHRELQSRVSPGSIVRLDICIVDDYISHDKAVDICRESDWNSEVHQQPRITSAWDVATSIAILHAN
jgi:hypothetical protein